MSTAVERSPEEKRVIPVALSSASVYPLSVHDAFAVAQDLGFDGVEVMVTNNATSQSPHSSWSSATVTGSRSCPSTRPRCC